MTDRVNDGEAAPSPKIRVLGCLNASPEADADLLRRFTEDPDGHVRKAARQRTGKL